MTQTKKYILIAIVTAIVSVGISLYLTSNHYDLVYGTSTGKSLCNINQRFNCDAVDASPFSSIFHVPLALWGAITYGALAIFLLAAFFTESARQIQWLKAAVFLNGYTFFMSIVMGAITVLYLKAICVFCVALYGLSIIGFGATILSLTKKARFELGTIIPDFFRGGEDGMRSASVLILAVPIVTLLTHSLFKQEHEGDGTGLKFDPRAYVTEWKTNSVQDFSSVQGLAFGAAPENAKVTIVEFADFLCPHCRHASPVLHAFTQNRPDVRFIFYTFPLDGQCNAAIKQSGDGARCNIAKAVWCAEKQGKGWEAHHWGMEEFLPASDVLELATILKIDKSQLDACIKDSSTHDAVMKQGELGARVGVKGTPAIFLNGKELPAGQMRLVLEMAYEEAKK